MYQGAFAIGMIIGPSVGGWTAFPSETMPSIFSKSGVFGRFPALLPNFIAALGLGTGVLLTLNLFPKNRPTVEEARRLISENKRNDHYGMDSLHPDEKHSNISLSEGNTYKNFRQGTSFCDLIKSSLVFRVLMIRECWFCCLVYGLFSVADVGFIEMFPVLAATLPEYKGLGFTPTQLGTVLMVCMFSVENWMIYFQMSTHWVFH